ncbi:MAG: lytic transglycosylase domain-containing protein [Acutalibacteraceae bacterium]
MSKKSKAFIVCTFVVIVAAIVAVIFHFGRSSVTKTLYPTEYSEFVETYCEEYNLEKSFIYAVIKCESNFDKNAVSAVNAKGLMQLMPDTFDWLKMRLKEPELSDEMMFDPETSIRYGCYLYRYLIDDFGDVEVAVAAYHAGLGNAAKWLKNKEYSDDGKTLKKIPFPSTEQYVEKVMKTKQIYEDLYDL